VVPGPKGPLFGQGSVGQALYDMVLPMNRVNVAKAGALIEENLIKDAVRRTNASMQAQKDFLLAATVEMALSRAGHDVSVAAQQGWWP
jgi:two-component system response regulator CpxR